MFVLRDRWNVYFIKKNQFKSYLFKYELLVKSPFKSKSISSVQPSRAKWERRKQKDSNKEKTINNVNDLL